MICPWIKLEDRMRVVVDLWERGVLMTSQPLEAHYDDRSLPVFYPHIHLSYVNLCYRKKKVMDSENKQLWEMTSEEFSRFDPFR